MSFEIKLPLFEGPFDLLLFFIERDELDIHDIPISKITRDFLDYLHHLEIMNIEVASEFILVAATLMRIKSRMLLPRPQLDEAGNEIDPREELIRHLLEYKKYKSVLSRLQDMEEDQMYREKRGNVKKEVKSLSEQVNVEAELQDLDLYKLMKVFHKVMERYQEEQNKPVHHVIQFPFTIEGQKTHIIGQLIGKERLSFAHLLDLNPSKIGAIFNFLAILELLQLNMITLHLGEGFNNFWIEKLQEVPIE